MVYKQPNASHPPPPPPEKKTTHTHTFLLSLFSTYMHTGQYKNTAERRTRKSRTDVTKSKRISKEPQGRRDYQGVGLGQLLGYQALLLTLNTNRFKTQEIGKKLR